MLSVILLVLVVACSLLSRGLTAPLVFHARMWKDMVLCSTIAETSEYKLNRLEMNNSSIVDYRDLN